MDIMSFARIAASTPETAYVFSHPCMTVGALLRRQIRAGFAAASQAGATVTLHEERGWLDSVFTFRVKGTWRQLEPLLEILFALSAVVDQDGGDQ